LKTICLDLTNIIPGVGGVGGGIATYGKSLVVGLDGLLTEKPDLLAQYNLIVLLNERNNQNFQFENVKFYNFKVNNQSLLSRMIWLHLRLPNFLKKSKVDLLHRVVSELSFKKVCKTVVTIHDFMFDFYLKESNYSKYLKFKEVVKFQILNKLLYRSLIVGDNLLVTSKAVKDEILRKVAIDAAKIKVIPLAYENNSVKSNFLEKPENQSNEKFKFGVVAAFHPHKGHLKVLKLAKKMIEIGYGDQIHFYFRGSPIYENYYLEVQELIKDLELEDHVTFEQYDPNITLNDIYNKYTATILLSDYEGFGLPVIEAQAFQKPVICSGLPVFKEILGDSAIFLSQSVSEEEIHLLFEKLNDNIFIQNLLVKGNENAQRFSWKHTCEQVLASYIGLLEMES